MPPPAAATHRRQKAPLGADALPQFGSTASAVTRPDSCVAGPVWVAGSKNWEASPETFGVTGPRACQGPGATAVAAWNAPWEGNACRELRPDLAAKALPLRLANRSSTEFRGYARLATCSAAGLSSAWRSASPPKPRCPSNRASLCGLKKPPGPRSGCPDPVRARPMLDTNAKASSAAIHNAGRRRTRTIRGPPRIHVPRCVPRRAGPGRGVLGWAEPNPVFPQLRSNDVTRHDSHPGRSDLCAQTGAQQVRALADRMNRPNSTYRGAMRIEPSKRMTSPLR